MPYLTIPQARNITVPTDSGPVELFATQQGPTLQAQPPALTGTILVDPQIVSGVATDTNPPTVTVAGFKGPVYASWRGLVNAWGTSAPVLSANTTIVFVSSHTDDSDPVVWTPIVTKNASIILQGVTVPVVTAKTVAGTVAKSRATGQLLNAGVGAGPAANQMFINTSRGFRAWLNAVVAGTTFSLSQALAPQTAGVFGFPAELDTTQNGDSASVVTLTAINVVKFAPIVSTIGGGLVALYQCTVFDPGGTPGTNAFELGMNTLVQECLINRIVCYDGRAGFDCLLMNCNLQGGINGGSASQGSYFLVGGIVAGPVDNTTVDLLLDGDVLLNATVFARGTGANGSTYGLVFIATGQVLHLYGYAFGFSNYGGTNPVLWGGGALDVCGRVTYPTAQTAVNTFLQTGGITMNSKTTATSCPQTNPVASFNNNVPLTPANLDAAVGAAGFGGHAFRIFSGASLESSNFL